MKTYKTALYILLMLLGTTLSGHSQGITNNGYITGNSGSYLSLNGNQDLTIKSSTVDRFDVGNLTVDFTGSQTATLSEDSYLSVQNSLVMNDSLILKATSSNVASLITNGTVSGDGRIQQYLAPDEWHMVSSPVTNPVSGVYIDDYLYDWNEVDSVLHWISVVYQTLNQGQGFFAYAATSISSPTTVNFTGSFNTGDINPTISYTPGTGHGKGWNMVGNPYPSSLEWNNSWTKTNIDATIYIWDGATSQYKYFNYNSPGTSTLPNGEIMPGQGFWIKANAASPSITIPNSERLHSTNSFLKNSNNENNILHMTISDGENEDVAFLKLDKNGGQSISSQYDVIKLFGSAEVPAIYSLKTGEKCASNYLPANLEDQKINIGIYTANAGEFTLHFDNLESFDTDILIYLLDKEKNTFTSINELPNYSFFSTKGNHENRFEILFTKSPLSVENMNTDEQKIQMYAYQGHLFLKNNSKKKVNFKAYTLLSQQILTHEVAPHSSSVIELHVRDQYILVQASSDCLNITEKVSLH
jgi:hypothetical protein